VWVSVARSTTIRLYPLSGEHTLPMAVDTLVFTIVYGIWLLGLGMADGAWSDLGILAVVVLAHVVQMTWLVAVRFDDTAITIVRPWRRRRIEWTQISGLIYTQDVSSKSRAFHKLRLVLNGHEPPQGRFLTETEVEAYAKGPVVMTLADLEPDSWSDNRWIRRSVRCQNQVYAELERHGLPKPRPRTLEYRSPKYTPEQTRLAVVTDLIGLHPVTVNHGEPANDHDAHLIGAALPELARTHGATSETVSKRLYTIFFFDAEPAATAFIAAALEIAPADWRITPGALPAPDAEGDSTDRPPPLRPEG
jgi:hypothetical protein